MGIVGKEGLTNEDESVGFSQVEPPNNLLWGNGPPPFTYALVGTLSDGGLTSPGARELATRQLERTLVFIRNNEAFGSNPEVRAAMADYVMELARGQSREQEDPVLRRIGHLPLIVGASKEKQPLDLDQGKAPNIQ